MLIRLSNLCKVYNTGGVEVHALRDIDLGIDRAEFVAICGPSGSGKSTLMHILGCLDRPTSGNYFLDNTPISGYNDKELSKIRNRNIGFVFQSFNLIPQLTVRENVGLPLLYNRVPVDEIQKKVIDILGDVELEKRMLHRPAELSGGEQQRTAIARAIINNPSILLADEPTGNLDTRIGEEIMSIFSRLHKDGKTIVVVTHNDAVASYAERQINLMDGMIGL
ncbi:MAG: ABC transporter ATP-binding protein [Nitrospinota bacterium]